MSIQRAAVVVAIVASPALAHAQAPAEPAPLRLSMGSRVRLQTTAAPSDWTKGVLASADSSSVVMVPEGSPVIGDNQVKLPTSAVSRLDVSTGTKRHWLLGLAIGAAAGVAIGFAFDADPVVCEYDDEYFCSRGEAVAASGFLFGLIGTGVGALVKTEQWTPVALDALGPPAPRVSGVTPRLRRLPRGGVELALAFGF
jgi:hypothetical protein